jgi:hypothetical protein
MLAFASCNLFLWIFFFSDAHHRSSNSSFENSPRGNQSHLETRDRKWRMTYDLPYMSNNWKRSMATRDITILR